MHIHTHASAWKLTHTHLPHPPSTHTALNQWLTLAGCQERLGSVRMERRPLALSGCSPSDVTGCPSLAVGGSTWLASSCSSASCSVVRGSSSSGECCSHTDMSSHHVWFGHWSRYAFFKPVWHLQALPMSAVHTQTCPNIMCDLVMIALGIF